MHSSARGSWRSTRPWLSAALARKPDIAALLVAIRPTFALGPLAPLGLLLTILLVLWLVRRLSRRLEERADRVAVEHQRAPGAYARALGALYEANLAPAVLRSRRTVHPHLYDRLLAAGVTPDYPRPLPPSRWVHISATVAGAALVALPLFGLRLIASELANRDAPSAMIAAFALGTGRPAAFVFLARHADEAGDPTRALELWSAAAATDPRRTDVVRYLTMRLARLRRCDDAERELKRALAREPRTPEEARDLAKAADWVKMCRR